MAKADRNPATRSTPGRDADAMFAPPAVNLERRGDGTLLLRSPQPLGDYARCVGEWLEHWGRSAPERPFLLERAQGAWRGVTYGDTLDRVRRIATWLLGQNLSPERPVAILSDNSVEHGLLSFAAMHVGIPVAPVSPAYSLMSKDFGKLKTVFEYIRPGVIYVADAKRFAPALAAVSGLHDGQLLVGSGSEAPPGALRFADLLVEADHAGVTRAYQAVGPDTIAKFLFTSGSTGEPKGVINTQRMMCSNQQAMLQVWPFLEQTPPVLVDWLPWNHTFGGNHNINMVLRHGGTLYIDAGRPLPGLFEHTIASLREVAPTIYLNVPRAYDMLVTALRADEALRRNFFSRLQLIFYAAAALPQHLWEALEELSQQTLGRQVPMVSSWGLTETAPAVTSCHFQSERSGVIGLPLPGSEVKLVPNGDKLEIRVRGPNVTPGYWKRPDVTARSKDEEGFYLTGDAMRFAHAQRPERGLMFDGRVAEDFKLSTATWVNAGAVRVRGIAALAPVAQDIVVTGHDRDEIGFLVFPNVAACRGLCADLAPDAPLEQVLAHPAVRARVAAGLAAMKHEGGGSSTYATRALLMAEPPSIDAGEITDKGYINQRAVLTRRVALVEMLYGPPQEAVIRAAE